LGFISACSGCAIRHQAARGAVARNREIFNLPMALRTKAPASRAAGEFGHAAV
jgi:hypothetical protein